MYNLKPNMFDKKIYGAFERIAMSCCSGCVHYLTNTGLNCDFYTDDYYYDLYVNLFIHDAYNVETNTGWDELITKDGLINLDFSICRYIDYGKSETLFSYSFTIDTKTGEVKRTHEFDWHYTINDYNQFTDQIHDIKRHCNLG